MNPIVSPDVRDAYFGSLDKVFEGFSFIDDSSTHVMQQGVAAGVGVTAMSCSVPRSGAGATLLAHGVGKR
jgi:hypothetical protein